MRWNVIAALVVGVAVGATSAWFLRPTVDWSTNVNRPEDLLKALSIASNQQVNADACEKGAPRTIGEFMAEFSVFPQKPTWAAFKRLGCSGLNCRLSFGQAKDIEGWSRILEFKLNERDRSIASDGTRCLDVP